MTATQCAVPLSAVDGWTSSGRGDVVTVRARKQVVATDPYLAGHFPGNIIFPAVFILEGVRQAVAGALAAPAGEVAALRSLRMHRSLAPGDELHLDLEVRPLASGAGNARRYDVRAVATCGGEPVAKLAVELDV